MRIKSMIQNAHRNSSLAQTGFPRRGHEKLRAYKGYFIKNKDTNLRVFNHKIKNVYYCLLPYQPVEERC